MNFGYKKLYYGGTLRDASQSRKKDIYCPATDEKIGEIAWATSTDTEKILIQAKESCKSWSKTPVKERVAHMHRLRDLVVIHQEKLRMAEMYENGKTYEQTEEGYQRVVDALEFYAEEIMRKHGHLLVDSDATHEHKISYHAAGVVGAFVAWNFPLLNLAFKLGPAMAAGCPLILRPAPETPISAYIIGELCEQAGLPPGVVNILTGPIEDTADIICKSEIPSVLTLIGSTKTACTIMKNASTSIKRYSMELGGNAPAIVFPDADLELASTLISILKTSNAGQICVTPNRIFVHDSIHDEFLSKLVDKVKNIKIGHGKDSGVDMGPVISKEARQRIIEWIQIAIKDGAQLIYGGTIPEGLEDKGSYFLPTILDNVSSSTKLSCEEIFGPVMSIFSFKDYEEVIQLANNTNKGLASYVFSNDMKTVQKVSADLEFGEVQVNGVKYAIDLPHVGIKQSGVGMDCSSFALDDYLVMKRTSIAL